MSNSEAGDVMNTNHPAVSWIAAIVGIALVALAIMYWVEPAGSLPGFIPGHTDGSAHHHVKHGIAAFLLGAALLILVWFRTGNRDNSSRSVAE